MWQFSSKMFFRKFASFALGVFLLGISFSHGCQLAEVQHCVRSSLRRSSSTKNPAQLCRSVPGIASCLGFVNSVDESCSKKTDRFMQYLDRMKTFCSGIDTTGSKCKPKEAKICLLPLDIANNRGDFGLKCQAALLSVPCLNQLKSNCKNDNRINRIVDSSLRRSHNLIRTCDDTSTTIGSSTGISDTSTDTTPYYSTQSQRVSIIKTTRNNTDSGSSVCTIEDVRKCVPIRLRHSDDTSHMCMVINRARFCFETLRPKCDTRMRFYINKGLKRIQKHEKACESLCADDDIQRCLPSLEMQPDSSQICQIMNNTKSCFDAILPNCDDSKKAVIGQALAQFDHVQDMCSSEGETDSETDSLKPTCTPRDVQKCLIYQPSTSGALGMCRMLRQTKSCLDAFLPNCDITMRKSIEKGLARLGSVNDMCGTKEETDTGKETLQSTCTIEDMQKCMPSLESTSDVSQTCQMMNKSNTCLVALLSNCDETIRTSIEQALSQFENIKDMCSTIDEKDSEKETLKTTCTFEDVQTCMPSPESMSDACQMMDDTKSCFNDLLPNCDDSKRAAIEQALAQFEHVQDMCSTEGETDGGKEPIPSTCTLEDIHKCMPSPESMTDISQMCPVMNKSNTCLVALLSNCDGTIRASIEQALSQFENVKDMCSTIEEKDSKKETLKTACTFEDVQTCMPSPESMSDASEMCQMMNDTKSCFNDLLPNCDGSKRAAIEQALAQFEHVQDMCSSKGEADGGKESIQSTCTPEDLQKCMPSPESMSDISQMCPVMNKSNTCLVALLSNCDGTIRTSIEQALSQFENVKDMCSTIEEKDSKKETLKTTCTFEDVQTCMPSPESMSDASEMCQMMNDTKSCFNDLLPNCDGSKRAAIEQALAQFEHVQDMCSSKGEADGGKESIQSTCTPEDLQKCMPPPESMYDVSQMCQMMNKTKTCLVALLPKCDRIMKAAIEQGLSQFESEHFQDICSTEGETGGGKEPIPSTCTLEDIHKCMPSPESMSDISQMCPVINKSNTCLVALLSNCDGTIRTYIEQALSQFENVKDMCSTIEEKDSKKETLKTTCTFEDVQTCMPSPESMSDASEMCQMMNDTKSCFNDLLPNCDDSKRAAIEQALVQFEHVQDMCSSKGGADGGKESIQSTCTPEDLQKCMPSPESMSDISQMCPVMNKSNTCLVALLSNCDGTIRTSIEQALSQFENVKDMCSTIEEKDGKKETLKTTCTFEDVQTCMPSPESMSDASEMCQMMNDTKSCFNYLLPNCDGSKRAAIEQALAQFEHVQDMCSSKGEADGGKESIQSTCTPEDLQKCMPPPESMYDVSQMCQMMNKTKTCLVALLPKCDRIMKAAIEQGLSQFEHVQDMCSTEGETDGGKEPIPSTCTLEDIHKCMPSPESMSDISQMCPVINKSNTCLVALLSNCDGTIRTYIEQALSEFENVKDMCSTIEEKDSKKETLKTTCTFEDVQTCMPSPESMSDASEMCQMMNDTKSCFNDLLPNCDDSKRAAIEQALAQFEHVQDMCSSKGEADGGKESIQSTCTPEDLQKCMPPPESMSDISKMCQEMNKTKTCLVAILPKCDRILKAAIEQSLSQFEHVQDMCSSKGETDGGKGPIQSTCTTKDLQKCMSSPESMSDISQLCQMMNKSNTCLVAILPNCDETARTSIEQALSQGFAQFENIKDMCSTIEKTDSGKEALQTTCTFEDVQTCMPSPESMSDASEMCQMMHDTKSCFNDLLPNCDDSKRAAIEQALAQFEHVQDMCNSKGEIDNKNETLSSTCTYEDIQKCVPSLESTSDISQICQMMIETKSCFDSLLQNCDETKRRSIEQAVAQFENVNDMCSSIEEKDAGKETFQFACTFGDIQTCMPSPESMSNASGMCQMMYDTKSCFNDLLPNCDHTKRAAIEQALAQFEHVQDMCSSKGEIDNKNETPSSTCTYEDIQKCVPSLGSTSVVSQICQMMNETKSCFDSLLQNCDETKRRSIEFQLEHATRMCRTEGDGETDTKPLQSTCTAEDLQKCVPSLESMRDTSEMCQAMDNTKACFEALLSNCDDTKRAAIEQILEQFEHTKDMMCSTKGETDSGKETLQSTCTFEDMQTCMPSAEPMSDASEMCHMIYNTKSCFDDLLPNCDDTKRAAIGQALAQFEHAQDMCSTKGETYNKNETLPSTCTYEEIQKCFPSQDVPPDMNKLCHLINDVKTCFNTILPNCNSFQRESIEQALNQFQHFQNMCSTDNDKDTMPSTCLKMGNSCLNKSFTSCTEEDISHCMTEMINIGTNATPLETCIAAEGTRQCFAALDESGMCYDKSKQHVERLFILTKRMVSFCKSALPSL